MKKVSIYIWSILLSTSTLFGQSSQAKIDQLSKELFYNAQSSIPLYDIIGCENQKVDSTILIRKEQPNVDQVLILLEAIMMEKDTEVFDSLLSIYDKQINLYWKEWGQLYRNNFYACHMANEQFRILRGFEVVLRSLELKKKGLSTERIFDDYIKLCDSSYQMLVDIKNRADLIKKDKVFSPLFRKLNQKAWFAGKVPFCYVNPYLKELTPYFISLLKNCNFEESSETDCRRLRQAISLLITIKSPEISEHIINNYDDFSSSGKFYIIFKYAGNHHFPKLAKLLAKKIIDDPNLEGEKVDPRYNYFRILNGLPANRPLIKQALLTELKKETIPNINALKLIKYFPDEETMNVLIPLWHREKISDESQKAFVKTLRTIARHPQLSSPSKRAIKKLLKDI